MQLFKIKKGGFSLVETLFYVSVLAMVALVVMRAILSMIVVFHETQVNADLASGSVVMERISREIRLANKISSINATSILLDTKDDSNNPRTVQMALAGSNLEFTENGTLVGNLNSTNLAVTGVTFYQITMLHSQAVRVVLSVRSNRYGSTKVENYYDTVVLRGAYYNNNN